MVAVVRRYIETHQLLPDDKPVVVGLSGGADSVALLAVLKRLGYACVAAHCNFHLRGEESDRDEAFARSMAERLSIPFYHTDFQTTVYAATRRLSIEMAARELRYQWFESLRVSLDAQAIAVAHHRDDSAETLLLNMIRGTGIRGMGGIRPKKGYVVRPLLCVGRDDVMQWLDEQSLSYVTDSTNLEDVYTRNFIRLRVLPLLEEINPSVRAALARTAENISAAEVIYLQSIDDARRKVLDADNRLSIPILMGCSEPETILYELLSTFDFTRPVSQSVYQSLTKTSGKVFYSSTHRLIKDRDYLLIAPLLKEETAPGYVLDTIEGEWENPVRLSIRLEAVDVSFQLRKDKNIAYFDAGKLQFPLSLRRWQSGDWFIPFGIKGRQKLSDYFSDHKFSRIQKEKTWLLCSGDNIIWIVGERADERFRINETTKQALIVKISG